MSDEKLHVVLDVAVTRDELEKTVDADIADFNEFFKSLGNEPLVRSEIAVIKTYLAFKLKIMKNKT